MPITPTPEQVRANYVADSVAFPPSGGWHEGEYQRRKDWASEEFDNMIREVRRKAWEEGKEALGAHFTKPIDPATGYRPPLKNPYEV